MAVMTRLNLSTLALGTSLLLGACGAPTTTPPPAVATAPAPTAAAAGAPTTAAAAPKVAKPAPTTAAAKAPVVLKMARNQEPGVFVPWLIDDNTALFTLANVYDGLLRVTKDGASVEPALATKWDTSTDGLTWTFTLRPGVKFSDGTALTATDVKVSLDIARGGEKSTWKDNYKAIKEVQAPD